MQPLSSDIMQRHIGWGEEALQHQCPYGRAYGSIGKSYLCSLPSARQQSLDGGRLLDGDRLD